LPTIGKVFGDLLERYLQTKVCSQLARSQQETAKQGMKILFLMALFSAIAAASRRQERGEQPKPAA
jgi:hypothetical protein